MMLKDFKIPCLETVLDEVFLLPPQIFRDRLLDDISCEEIAETSGLGTVETVERLQQIEKISQGIFCKAWGGNALLLDVEIGPVKRRNQNIMKLHETSFTDVMEAVRRADNTLCLSSKKSHAFSAAMALRMKGFAKVYAATWEILE